MSIPALVNRIVLILFIFGMALFFLIFYGLYREGLVGEKNLANCQEVEIGMSAEKVIDIMGDPEKIHEMKIYSGSKRRKALRYQYIGIAGASIRVDIHFDPKTNQVIRIDCDDSYFESQN